VLGARLSCVVLTTDPDLPPVPPSEPEPAKSLWARLPADMRNLIVTAAGTVIGGVLLLIMVALGVITARALRHGLGDRLRGLQRRFRRRHLVRALDSQVSANECSPPKVQSLGAQALFAIAGVSALVLVLALLGVAAGIR
jgi:hypothetical protein